MRSMKHGGGWASSGTFEVYSASTDTWLAGNTRTAWAANTVYSAGALCSLGGNLYSAVIAGTSAATGGPTGTESAIVDGTVTWKYMTVAAITPLGTTNVTIMDGVGQTTNGSGYVAGSLTIGQGNAFAGTVNLTGTAVSSVTITNPGALMANPGVTFVGAGSTVAAAYPTYKLVGAYYKNKGAGYVTAPNVTFNASAWAASTALTISSTAAVQKANGGKLYNLVSSGTTAAAGGPTGTGTNIVEGTPWQPSTVYAVGNQCVNGGNLYVVASIANTNTSAASGGPAGTTAGIVDNDVTWNYVAVAAVWNYVADVPTCHAVVSGGKVTSIVVDNASAGYYPNGASFASLSIDAPYPSWVLSTAYNVGDIRSIGGKAYTCTVAGTSAATGGPTGSGTNIVDGTVTWDYLSDVTTASYGALMAVDNVVITSAGSYTVAPAIFIGSSMQVGNNTNSRTVTVNGDLIIKNGATFYTGKSQTLNVGGNLIAESPVTFLTPLLSGTASTTVNFTKAGAASISGPAAATFKGVTIGATTALTFNSTGNQIGATFDAGSLTVNAGGSLTLAAGKALTVYGNIANAGTINLNNDSGAPSTLITTGTITGAGTSNVQQYLTGTGGATPNGKYWYVSSPLTNATSAVYDLTETSTPLNQLWSYSESLNDYTRVTSAAPVTLTPGVGFAAQLGDNKTVTLAGASINNGPISIVATRSAYSGVGVNKRGFNLVGNPYPSYLNINTAMAAAVGMESSVWYRTYDSSSNTMVFDTYNSFTGDGISLTTDLPKWTNSIPPMQAFWVRVSADSLSGSMPLTTAMLTHQPIGNLTRSESATPQMIRLQVSNGVNSDQALIGFYPEATNLFDKYDSHKMPNESKSIPEIYTYVGSDQVAINGMAPLTENQELVLGFKTGKTGNYTIKAMEICNFDPSTKVILKDKVLNITQNLNQTPIYTFASDSLTTDARFSVVIEKFATKLDVLNHAGFEVFVKDNDQIQVYLNDAKGKQARINVYNALGQQMVSTTTSNSSIVINRPLNRGVYIVKVYVGGTQSSKKVVINK
ncbi:MAG TPA: T9SS type A sorting domain-containing protein [Bacteroidales bacterium]|nr:T9SS type A sorting domain-containing protein [Bacteroidales bacterium]